jgi:TolA-binding protein
MLFVGSTLLAACAQRPVKGTLAQLHDLPPDVKEVEVKDGLDQAMLSYRRYLAETPRTELTPEAMRRLADLKVEKEFGLRGDGKADRDSGARGRPTSQLSDRREAGIDWHHGPSSPTRISRSARPRRGKFRGRRCARVTTGQAINAEAAGPLEAIQLYDQLLSEYPDFEHNDQVLYQKARALDELGRTDEAIETMQQLVSRYAHSPHYDEVLFRRAEYFFTRRKFRDAESAYATVINMGPSSSYYELALYKLGWTLYKQEFYDEAQRRFIALLDYKVSIGYDFDQKHDENDERRVADTFRVISLGFSNLGGPEVVQEYFAANGRRTYEDRIYANLGEYYFAKLRYDDAAKTYKAFVALNPYHRSSPHFSMRVVEIYAKADFPKLVLESKKEFASRYGVHADYWRHFDINEAPEVLSYLKSNLRDLANHHHAQYQNAQLVAEKPTNYAEALHWYHEYLSSFPKDADTPPINYQLADLMLENKDYGQAAVEYERTAYDYTVHEKSAAAGYAAIYAHREELAAAPRAQPPLIGRRGSLKFADTFPTHPQAATVLSAAADDLYGMNDFARVAAAKLIGRYPAADMPYDARHGPSSRTRRSSSPTIRRRSRRMARCCR